MPKLHPIQRRFTAGVLSPRLHAQSDIEGYSAGLAECVNYVPTKHGSITRRDGFKHIATVAGTNARILPFQLTPDSPVGEAFIVVVSDDGTISVVGANGYSAGEEVITNIDFAGGIEPWMTTTVGGASATWSSGRVRMDGGQSSDNYVYMSQEVTIPVGKENDDHRLVIDLVDAEEDFFPNVNYAIGTSQNGEELTAFAFVGTGNEYLVNPSGNGTIWVTLRVRGSEPNPGEPGMDVSEQFYRDVTNVSMTNSVEGGVSFAHPWGADQISRLKSWPHPTEYEIFILTGSSAPYKLFYDETTNAWGFEEIVFTALPTEWTGTNWPSTMTFFQGRSWWGGLAENPVDFWGSVSNNYVDFTLATGDEPDKAFQLSISAHGKIQWMEGIRNLMIGTSNKEYIVTSEGGIIYGGDFKVEPQSANGGTAVASLPIGNSAFYVSSDSRKIYSASYQWTEQTWSSRDITFSAEHLTESASITRLAYSKNPENLIWASTSDNKFIGATYQPSAGTIGWHTHSVDGDVLSLAVIEESGSSNVYAIVRRTVLNTIVLTLEVMDSSVYMDGTAVLVSDEPTDTVTGILHLAGKTVRATVDSAVHPEFELDENGDATLNYSGTTIHIGLPFTSAMKTLPADYGAMSGSGMSMKKGWNSISLRLLDSAFPKVNGIRPPSRTPSSRMGTREAYYTGDIDVANLGYDVLGQNIIEEDLPVKSTILGIFGEMNQGSL